MRQPLTSRQSLLHSPASRCVSHWLVSHVSDVVPLPVVSDKDVISDKVVSTHSINTPTVMPIRMETTTCWIAAENALQHIQKNLPQIEDIFKRYHIEKTQYGLYAGFDEYCFQANVGLLEQVHIFTLSMIPSTSPLLSELGKVLSPFSSILFTESSALFLPIYKADGVTPWEFNDLVFETASKYMDHGSTAAMYPTVISLFQNREEGEERDGNENGGGEKGKGRDGNGDGGEEIQEKEKGGEGGNGNGGEGKGEGKGKGRDDGKGGEGIEKDDDSEDPGYPDSDPENETTNSPHISFEVNSHILSEPKNSQSRSQFDQSIRMTGGLTIKVCHVFPQGKFCVYKFYRRITAEFGIAKSNLQNLNSTLKSQNLPFPISKCTPALL